MDVVLNDIIENGVDVSHSNAYVLFSDIVEATGPR